MFSSIASSEHDEAQLVLPKLISHVLTANYLEEIRLKERKVKIGSPPYEFIVTMKDGAVVALSGLSFRNFMLQASDSLIQLDGEPVVSNVRVEAVVAPGIYNGNTVLEIESTFEHLQISCRLQQ